MPVSGRELLPPWNRSLNVSELPSWEVLFTPCTVVPAYEQLTENAFFVGK